MLSTNEIVISMVDCGIGAESVGWTYERLDAERYVFD